MHDVDDAGRGFSSVFIDDVTNNYSYSLLDGVLRSHLASSRDRSVNVTSWPRYESTYLFRGPL